MKSILILAAAFFLASNCALAQIPYKFRDLEGGKNFISFSAITDSALGMFYLRGKDDVKEEERKFFVITRKGSDYYIIATRYNDATWILEYTPPHESIEIKVTNGSTTIAEQRFGSNGAKWGKDPWKSGLFDDKKLFDILSEVFRVKME